ncbi:MAG: hemerythrin domain-containing protein [Magnetococcales bacterium]|nr:hemerythrin domain-containing protein [Magnetococcales bacterium]
MQIEWQKDQEINLYGSGTRKTPFLWTSGLYTGYDAIDRQHQEIYEALMGVSLLLEMPDVNFRYWLGMVGRKMEDYVITHFRDEEQLMAFVGYPDMQAHKIQHLNFIEAFKKHQTHMAQLTTDAERIEESKSLLKFLNDWFDMEVMSHDKDFADFIKNKSR